MKKYFLYNIKKILTIKNLITIEYLDIKPNFKYESEIHSFYEFAFIDKGSINCVANNKNITLKQNDSYIILPGTHHFYEAISNTQASIFIICFSSSSSVLSLIGGITSLEASQIKIITNIIDESMNAFVFPFNKKLILKPTPVFGAQQLVEEYVEMLLITMIRNKIEKKNDASEKASIEFVISNEELNKNLINDILKLLTDNIYGNITLDFISKSTFYSKTYLNNFFKNIMHKTIKQYYIGIKIKESKNLLAKGFSQTKISDLLCFDTPNYFSKTFKKITGQTPSQFKKQKM